MIAAARRAFRTLFPRRMHPLMDADPRPFPDDDTRGAAYDEVIRAAGGTDDPFLAARFREGLRWRTVLDAFAPRQNPRVLDVGAGNGAIELALGSGARFTPFSVDALWNETASEIHRRAGAPLRRIRGTAAALPFEDGAFGALVCLETIEHLAEPARAAREMSRVTAAGGVILLTTPPRWRYAARPDPHFGIRGLVLLPPRLQRRAAAARGFGEEHHYVDRIYGSVGQIARLFPGCAVEAVLSRSRAPQRWFWDAIVLRRVARR